MPLPVLVIVGRPNVGKSTLFNAILRERRAIVGNEPGITRDRIQREGEYRGRRFELIDTGGLIPDDAQAIPSAVMKQARVALDRAAHIIFLIDGRTEITGSDRDLAKMLRRLGKPMSLAVNKIDAVARESLAHDFYSLGIADLFPISAEHRLGLDDLLNHVTRGFAEEEAVETACPTIKIAIIGRPNVGKSTLLNALVGQERSIVSSVAGTTRDAVDESVIRDGIRYVFVDTAGIRRKGKTKLMAEKLSVVMARRHIRLGDVVLLVLDASEGLVGLDANIAGYADDDGKALIICVNKWDITRTRDRKEFAQQIKDDLKFLDWAPVVYLSATTGRGVDALYKQIRSVYESASVRISTGELNRFVSTLPVEKDRKIRYLTQPSVRPPTFVLFTDKHGPLHFSTERFLVNQLRKRFGFQGTPVVLKIKSKRP